jgi:PPK2 family polyphosphate:nucleotide phosphotransferase
MKLYRVKPNTKVDLHDWDPDATPSFKGNKADGVKALEPLTARLEELQELLYAEGRRKILIVLQAMDAGGKDGTIRHVFDGVNPQGVKVASFKAPTVNELAYDYLWRVHGHVPAKGEITIFNRSHYEDVLVVRVKKLAPPSVWRRRYEQINDFERMLTEEGATILKFYLHISKDEQKKRLQERLAKREKHWKFSTADLKERARWGDYAKAYESVLSKTSTKYAPWYVIPANRKWYRNLVISRILVDTLEGLDMRYPAPEKGLDKVVVD